ncbi:tudor domain-containing protein 15 [Cheilinus undulatus]|uniref:tudor domain-containing protein 15 n=1 Tax=Cheilinus undulatus TaxID=241271 RepID=UPI001BD48C2A|nr:tudor domain-containing protein 15 [Cheilinus undulatus]XP_041661768.1 tudor domain-containing protein 15 [Cheilinus undulatus]XP_041661769.1 tudor domain-containing protein 15 [Cheilinus undulatus]
MQSVGSEHQKSQNSGKVAPFALWPVDLKLTHLDWNPEATLIHFQGQYLTICELDYNILQGEIQSVPKTKSAVDIGEFCLVEDLASARWYRGRVQNRKEGLFDVFLIDHGNVLSVDINRISPCSSDLFILPPKIVCGFLANVLLLQSCSCSVVEEYLANLIGRSVAGYIQALLPHKVQLLEAPDINTDLVRHGLGRHVDTETFLLLVEMLTEVPLKHNTEPVPDLLIEKPRGQEFSFKPCGLRGHEQILSLCGPKLPSGTKAKVRVTAAVNPGLFYCQMTSKETELWEMSRKLSEVCEYTSKQHQKTSESLGLLCSAKGKDGKWYRGFVQYLPVNSQVRVLFIDYGFFETVKIENVHKLPPDIYSAPIMALPCSLSCLSDQDDVLKTQQLGFLQAGLLGKVLDVEIRSFDEEKHLYSITVTGLEENHVNRPELIKEIPQMDAGSAFETKESSPQSNFLNCETIIGKKLDKTLEEEELHVGSVFVGYVEYVHNPHSFWIRTQKRNDEFEEMMEKMSDHFSQVKLDEDVLLNPELGTMCCALFEDDMHFYRGVVTDTLEHGAEVLFIDFGNIDKVPHKLIKKIPEKFVNKSAFAFCCSLVNVVPLEEVWTSTTSAFFKTAVSNKAMLVHVVQVRKNKLVVDLQEMGHEKNQSITELLISSNQAEYWNNISIEPVEPKDKEKSSWPENGMTSDINERSEQWDDCEDEEKVCKEETDKVQTPAHFKALNIKPGYDFAVRCTYITSPSEFWCQPLDKVQDLEELMDKVKQYYSAHRAPLQSEDACCIAKSHKDGTGYRAVIIEKSEGKQNLFVKVMLVDHGSTKITKSHNLQAIMPDFANLEGLAFRCSLYNVIKPVGHRKEEVWSPEVLNTMKDFVLNSNNSLRCTVVSQLTVKNKGLFNVIDLYNPQTKQSIAQVLLEQGLAREATVSAKQLSVVFPESFTYSSFDLTPGKEEQVFITHVSSHCEVFCHLERNTENIEQLESKISEASEKMLKSTTRDVVSKLCLAKYFDGKWYRGLINPVQSTLHLDVFFVDYGNTNILEKAHVMFIPGDSVELLYTPMQAVRCSLASVPKKEVCADVKEWLDEAILNNQVRAVITGKSGDGSFEVELFDGDVNINKKVNELIISLSPKPNTGITFDMNSVKRYQKYLSTNKAKSPSKSKIQLGKQSSYSPKSNANRGTQVRCASPKKTVNAKDAQRKKWHTNTEVKQEDGGNTKSSVTVNPQKTLQGKEQQEYFETTRKPEDLHLLEETETPQLLVLLDMKVSAGLKAKCFVSHIDSVNSFFLQLSEDEPAILKMAEDLNSGVLRDSLKTAASVRINDIVLAEYEEDGALYRASVKGYEGSTSLKVEFVDYGNSAVIVKKNIFTIPMEYISQPRFGIPCSLMETNMYKNEEAFTQAVMEKPLLVEFVLQCGAQWIVKVEILEGALGLPAEPEAAVLSCVETEKAVEAETENLPEIVECVRSCEQNNLTKAVSQNDAAKCKRMEETSTPYTPIGTSSPKVKVAICRRQRRPARSKTKTFVKVTALKSSAKAYSERADADKACKIKAKVTENATVLSVLSNGSFYIRLNKTCEQLAALESQIAHDLYKCQFVAEEDLRKNFRCLVQVDKDSQWQRAIVQQVGLRKCQVFLVDRGITEEIPNVSIRKICRDLKLYPKFAVLCKVNCPEGECANTLWRETLKQLTGKEIKLVFVSYSEVDKLWMVEIVMNGLLLVHPTLLQQDEAVQTPTETRNETEGENVHFDPGSSPLKQLVFASVDIDNAYSGFAAAVTTPFEFCIVLEDLLLTMNKLSMMLDELPEQMSLLPEDHLVPRNCCLIKSDSKKKWCRAEIMNIDTTVVLNLVDYGHCEYMPYEDLSKLKMLPEEMTNPPKMTYPCILRGVKPVKVKEEWTDEAAVFFQECLYQRNLQIFFREFVSNTHWKVDILVDGVHVAKKLVDAGHASYIDMMLGLRFQEQSLCKATSYGPDSKDESVQDDEASDGKLKLSVESTDKSETMPLNIGSGSRQCFLM